MSTTKDALTHLYSLNRSDLDAALAPPPSVPPPIPSAPPPPSATESLAQLDGATRAQLDAAREPVRAVQESFATLLDRAAETLALWDEFDQAHGAEVRELAGRVFGQNKYRLAGAPESLLIRLDRYVDALARSLSYWPPKLRALPDRVARLTAHDVRNGVPDLIRFEVLGMGTPSEDMLVSIRADLATLAEIMSRAAPARLQALPIPKLPPARPDHAITAYDVMNPSPNSARR